MDDAEIWWYLEDGSKLWWNNKKKKGLYFALEFKSKYADSLELPTDEAVYLSLYHTNDSNMEKAVVKKLRDHVSKHKNALRAKGFQVCDNDGSIISYTQSAELKLSVIQGADFPKNIIGKIKIFTEAVFGIVRNYRGEPK